MTSWPSKFRTHKAAVDALNAILDDIPNHPTQDYPALRYLADLIPKAPEGKKADHAYEPAFDYNEMESEA